MTLEELIILQKDFDSHHKGKFQWDQKIDENNLDMLEYILISLIGELGETANIVKKILRGDCSLEEKRENLNEEVIDIFIYTLKLAYQLDIDIPSTYLSKLDKNKQRFNNYIKE